MGIQTGVFFLALLSASGATARHQAGPCSPEQAEFSAEDSKVERPVGIPDDVLAILRNDEDVRRTLENEPWPVERVFPTWFSASVVHLDGPGEKDIVVMATGQLRGANITTFWVFRPTSRGHELILKVAEHDLIVTNKRWKGHRIIETGRVTGTLLRTARYRFDGGQYQGFSDTGWKEIR